MAPEVVPEVPLDAHDEEEEEEVAPNLAPEMTPGTRDEEEEDDGWGEGNESANPDFAGAE